MKNTHIAILAITVGLAVTLFAAEKQAAAPPASSPATHETFKAEVLKVFSATRQRRDLSSLPRHVEAPGSYRERPAGGR